ncbi:MAG: Peptide methionine sulfoxide reductase MsrA [Labilithrix sp.]|nr:Peptide methionine sulfoxide reductase MsrA [Labilithrix sp.]
MTARVLAPSLVLLLALTACRSVGTGGEGARPDGTNSAGAAQTTGASARRTVGNDPGHVGAGTPLVPTRPGDELAAFAGGCFWGVEDVLRQVPGVVSTAVGYAGGKTERPTYEAVCSHTTGHAETVLVEFDPARISYAELLVVFMENHDPTTMNRQGPDVGDQYRSEVFTFSDAQVAAAKQAVLTKEKSAGKKVVTRIEPIPAFWKAEEYHQQYDEKTGTHSCPLPRGLPKGA